MAQAAIAQTTGPENGSLVIVGGNGATDAILEKFIELAGGPENDLVVIPTAAGRDSYDQNAGIADRLFYFLREGDRYDMRKREKL